MIFINFSSQIENFRFTFKKKSLLLISKAHKNYFNFIKFFPKQKIIFFTTANKLLLKHFILSTSINTKIICKNLSLNLVFLNYFLFRTTKYYFNLFSKNTRLPKLLIQNNYGLVEDTDENAKKIVFLSFQTLFFFFFHFSKKALSSFRFFFLITNAHIASLFALNNNFNLNLIYNQNIGLSPIRRNMLFFKMLSVNRALSSLECLVFSSLFI